MSLLTRLFYKKKEEDYETILSELAQDIQKRQVKLSGIRLRERRATLAVTLYTLVAWVGYVILWYMNILPESGRGNMQMAKAIKGFPVIIGPIIILFIRRIVQIWYTRKGDAEERTLQNLLKQQRAKIEEVKKKTNYYSTRELLQRYDEPSPSNSPLRQRSVPPQPQPSTPQQLNYLATSSPAPQLTPPRKQWFDKLADVVLGDDDQSARYALICEKCFSHNGLVKESVWEDTQYVCPKCQHFNPTQRAKKQRASGLISSAAPGTPASATSSGIKKRSPASAIPGSRLASIVPTSPDSSPEKSETTGDETTGDESMMDIED
ncbi:hypothetical protein D9758_007708 [Tetrapyrgos nigripes]|uniref:Endoplasmic reticulum junction formation protein lunapark n=1 Tax=Tetrapyrgos nigripes TaxID=182062 RepID=A0A8H5G549_9AGAR|nr:hypothetical protein D9758_007708 [Tetrapyrgos nigripes]